MKNCNVPDDCWKCGWFDECKTIDEYKRSHPLPILPTVAIAILVVAISSGLVYLVAKCIRIILTSLHF